MAPKAGRAKRRRVKDEKKNEAQKEEKDLSFPIEMTLKIPNEFTVALEGLSTHRILDMRKLIADCTKTCHFTNYSLSHQVLGPRLNDSAEIVTLEPYELILVEEDYTEEQATAQVRRLLDIVACTTYFGSSKTAKESIGVKAVTDSSDASAEQKSGDKSPARPEPSDALVFAGDAGDQGYLAAAICPSSKIGEFYDHFSLSHLTPPIKYIRQSIQPFVEDRTEDDFFQIDVRVCTGKPKTIVASRKGFYPSGKRNLLCHSLVGLLQKISPTFDDAYKALMKALTDHNKDSAEWLQQEVQEQQEAAPNGIPKPKASVSRKGHLSLSELSDYIIPDAAIKAREAQNKVIGKPGPNAMDNNNLLPGLVRENSTEKENKSELDKDAASLVSAYVDNKPDLVIGDGIVIQNAYISLADVSEEGCQQAFQNNGNPSTGSGRPGLTKFNTNFMNVSQSSRYRGKFNQSERLASKVSSFPVQNKLKNPRTPVVTRASVSHVQAAGKPFSYKQGANTPSGAIVKTVAKQQLPKVKKMESDGKMKFFPKKEGTRVEDRGKFNQSERLASKFSSFPVQNKSKNPNTPVVTRASVSHVQAAGKLFSYKQGPHAPPGAIVKTVAEQQLPNVKKMESDGKMKFPPKEEGTRVEAISEVEKGVVVETNKSEGAVEVEVGNGTSIPSSTVKETSKKLSASAAPYNPSTKAIIVLGSIASVAVINEEGIMFPQPPMITVPNSPRQWATTRIPYGPRLSGRFGCQPWMMMPNEYNYPLPLNAQSWIAASAISSSERPMAVSAAKTEDVKTNGENQEQDAVVQKQPGGDDAIEEELPGGS